MKWIKATERLPTNNNLVHLRYRTNKTEFKLTGYYEPSENYWHRQTGAVHEWHPNLEWLDEQADDWIAVDAALPEKRIRVNICLDDDLVKIGYVDHDGKWKAEDWDFEKDGSGLSKVTRWQPLPSTPLGGDKTIK